VTRFHARVTRALASGQTDTESSFESLSTSTSGSDNNCAESHVPRQSARPKSNKEAAFQASCVSDEDSDKSDGNAAEDDVQAHLDNASGTSPDYNDYLST
jgi:hypothetical protein